jgi:hypothetical protein
VRSFGGVLQRLADVVEQRSALDDARVQLQLCGNETCERRYLDGVIQYILGITGAVAQLTECAHDFGMHARQPNL